MNRNTHIRQGLAVVGAALVGLYAARASAQAAATPRAFDSGDNPSPFPYSDFASGEYKAECSSGGVVFGLSAYSSAHSALCESPFTLDGGGAFSFNTSGTSTEVFSSSDSTDHGTYGDWDSGYYKGDCPANKFVIGLGQTTGGALDHTLCASGTISGGQQWGPSTLGCRTLTLPGDHPSSLPDGDWADGYYKLECDYSEVIVGVSVDTSNHHPHAIHCCTVVETGGH